MVGRAGDEAAFAALLEIPGVTERLALMARQRIAAHVRPVPVRLRDGTRLLFRPVLAGDRKHAAASLAALSRETVYQRFHSGGLSEATLDYLSKVDYVDHFAWVALQRADGAGLAHARFVRSPDESTSAEIAFSVGDVLQRRGLGTLLMGGLVVCLANRFPVQL